MKRKNISRLFQGLTIVQRLSREFVDNVWLDIFPGTTRELDAWEKQWGLQAGSLTEQERRDRLDAAWKAKGGQSPKYIQDTIQANGFDVYVHEWWVPGTEAAVNVSAAATPRDPTAIIVPPAYVLVNKITTTKRLYLATCGNPAATCGNPPIRCGAFGGLEISEVEYTIPTDPAYWPYFLYFGAETFPNLTSVPASRKDEFETLVLKLSPAHLWLGMLINYT